jgi:hypothetical protein
MIYHGFQLRCARTAIGLTTRDVRDRLGLSLTTIAKVEAASELILGETQRQKGTIERETVGSMISLYEGLGVTFLEAREPHGPGVRFTAPPAKTQTSKASTVKAARALKHRR